jgi:hypothetical protein
LENRVQRLAQPVSSQTTDFHVGEDFQQRPAPLGAGPAQRVRLDAARRPARRTYPLRVAIKKVPLRIFGIIAFVVGSSLLLAHRELQGPVLFDGPRAYSYSIPRDATTYADRPGLIAGKLTASTSTNAASIVAQGFSSLQQLQEAPSNRIAAKAAGLDLPQARVVSRGDEPAIAALHPKSDVVIPRTLDNIREKTTLIDFETAPFPYHGDMPGTNQRFLNVGQEGHRGHANTHGGTLWESQTYSDDRALLHIPLGFDPKRPAVMVVFFHGHGAQLARDVRDRQQIPAQVTAAGINAVLVAPQFAFDAADSSAGKFWELNGFKRFLDDAAVKLAGLYGDPRSAAAFANMPIVIVAYSGGFGPTLAVLERGGVRGRVRGLVLLDALYAGSDQFADWIANNRSAFFISSYTPHTARHNADLESLLRKHSVPYNSALRRSGLDGMVTFLPTGAISHRDFVTHAWANNPVKDILARMNDVYPKIPNAEMAASTRN